MPKAKRKRRRMNGAKYKQLRNLLLGGEMIPAIKVYRKWFNCSLYDAVEFIRSYRDRYVIEA